jgi:hypothetical protein
MKTCSVDGCTEECVEGRRLCKKHLTERRKELREAKKAAGLKYRTKYHCVCLACNKDFEGWSKNSLFCSKACYNSIKSNSGKNPYVYDPEHYRQNLNVHRNIAEETLGRKLNSNEVVHHLDCNPKNNDITNLIVISRGKHASLHCYLNKQRAIIERSMNVNSENCWNNLIVPMTTTWLETANVKVEKLWEIGQSAAEPLSNEEGSETMYGTSHVDEDIVQTTTVNAGLGN